MDRKISLCIIVKDEVEELDRCLKSIHKYVDEIVVAWNGTNIETNRVLIKYNARIIKHKWTGNFSEARQISFDNAKYEYVMWLDADDTFIDPERIRGLLAHFDDSRMGALWMYYDYERDDDDNTTMAVWRERIIKKKWFKWAGVVHEENLKTTDCIQAKIEKRICHVKHHPAKDRIEKSGARNLEISAKQYLKEHEINEVDAINVWNYAKSLNAMNKIEDALDIFNEFIQITESDCHRYEALCEAAKILRKLRKYDLSMDYNLQAQKLKPEWPYSYFGLAKAYFCVSDWNSVIHYTNLGFRCKDPSEVAPMAFDPMSITIRPLEPLVYALVQLGKFKEALTATEKALLFIPSNKYFKNWRKEMVKAIERERIEESCLNICEHLELEDKSKLENFSKCLPSSVEDHPVFVRLRNKFNSKGGKNRIVIYCGSSYELWDPLSANSGIGGSEEAVINMSKQLAKLGWNVEVYNNCLEPGNYDGVSWQGFWGYDKDQSCEIFISWRDTRPIMLAPKESYCILWLHDVWEKSNFTEQELDRVDKIFVLSNWHRRCMPDIEDDKFFVTRNGIISEQFEQKIERDPFSCIYASSPDRGLDIVLKNWGDIIKAVPDAKLHIFYGFTKTYDEVHKNDQRMKLFKEEVMELTKQKGVIYYGRVGHEELAQAFLGCNLWLYPTYFTEISCITAMKAQAAGAIPITTSMAALDETVQYGHKIEDKVIREKTKRIGKSDNITCFVPKNMQEEFVKKTVNMLASPLHATETRLRMMKWAKNHFAWETVAREWSEFFNEVFNANISSSDK